MTQNPKLDSFKVESLRSPWFPEAGGENAGIGKRGHSEDQILRVLRQADADETVVEACYKPEIRQRSVYLSERKRAGLGPSELRKLRQLREENGKLRCLVADLSLDCHILGEIVAKSCGVSDTARACRVSRTGLRVEPAPCEETDSGPTDGPWLRASPGAPMRDYGCVWGD
jgi:putative transposase